MLKKLRYIIALNLSIVMIFSSILPVSVFTYASNDKISDVEYELLDKLEIVTHDDLKNIDLNKTVTRAEFTDYIRRFLGIKSLSYDEVPFRDVDSSHPMYGSISTLYAREIIDGKSKYIFAPEATIKVSEGLKILMTALGYQPIALELGGFPAGYLSAASQAGLKGTYILDDELTHAQTIKLLFDALFVNNITGTLIDSNGLKAETSELTFMENVYNVRKMNGLVEETENASFRGNSTLNSDEVRVNTVVYKTLLDMNDCLGHYLTFYVKIDDDGEEEIISYELNSRYNDIIEVDAIDISPATTKNEFVYEDGNVERKIKISSVAVMIYNGWGKINYTDSDLIPASGKVILNDTDCDGLADVIFVKNYNLIIVKKVYNNANELLIVNTSGADFKINKNEIEYKLKVLKNGSEISVSEIGTNDVILVEDSGISDGKQMIVMNVQRKSAEGKLFQVTDKKAKIGDEEFEVNRLFDITNAQKMVGREVVFYLDSDGRVAHIVLKSDGEAYGYLYRSFIEETNDRIMVDILMENDEYKVFELADRVKSNGKSYDSEEIYNMIVEGGVTKMQLVRYQSGNDGKISVLNLAVTVRDDAHEKMLRETDTFRLSSPRKKRFFENRSKLFMSGPGSVYWPDLFIDSTLKVVSRPSETNPKKEDIYFLDYSYFKADMPSYDIEGYDLSETNLLGAVVVYGEKSADVVEKDQEFVVVSEVTQKLNEDDEAVETLVVYERGELKSYPTKENGLLQYKDVPLKCGDITRIIVDNKGFITALEPKPLKFSIVEDYTKYFTDAQSVGSDATAAYPYYQVVVGTVDEIAGDMLKVRVKNADDSSPQYIKSKLRTDTKYVKCFKKRGGYTVDKATKDDLTPGKVIVLRVHWTTLYDVVIYEF